jgi:hypothetical protein
MIKTVYIFFYKITMLMNSMLPLGIRAKTSEPPRVGEVKLWHKILPRDSLLEVQCPADAPVGIEHPRV